MELKNLINIENIFFMAENTKAAVLQALIDKSLPQGKVTDPALFRQALLEREALMSTGIGLGVAIPHAKLACITDFFITLGILDHPVEWDSLDRKPVRIVFLIGGPENNQAGYLQLLAQIMLVIKNETRLEQLLKAQNAQQAAAVFAEAAK